MNPKKFAERVKETAALVGGQAELAKRAGISAKSISAYALGTAEPSRPRLVAMADAAGVSAGWLATGQGPKIAQDQAGQADPTSVSDRQTDGMDDGAPACDCTSPERRQVRRRLLHSSLSTNNGVKFDILQHAMDGVREFQRQQPDALSQDDLGEVTMMIYSFCQPENRVAAEVICTVVLDWLAKTKTA